MTLVMMRVSFDFGVQAYSKEQALQELEKYPVYQALIEQAGKLELDSFIDVVELDEKEIARDREHQKKLNFSDCGEILFVENFWDCNCGKTHRKIEEPNCEVCMCRHDECPDSRADELLQYCEHLLTPNEAREIKQELEYFQQRLNPEKYVTSPALFQVA